ncbi:MAG: glucosamine-6-phosphate deaminase [Synechococcus sp.]|nr:MAG: glucosamine-6-phosphate deaminase [Synechococcus sp.]
MLAAHLERHLRSWQGPDPLKPLGLATGRTMEPLYRTLVERLLSWSADELEALRARWCSFNLDEYLGLSADDPRGYRAYMTHHLAAPLGLPASAVHLPDSTAADGAVAARRYGEQLSGCGGIGLQLLGLGSNGHVGFNEPPCPPDQHCHEVELTPATRQQNAVLFDGCVEAVPQRAITLGLWEILEAAEIHLVVTGAAKAGILKRLLDLSEPDPALPASWLLTHPNVWLWCDAAALA